MSKAVAPTGSPFDGESEVLAVFTRYPMQVTFGWSIE